MKPTIQTKKISAVCYLSAGLLAITGIAAAQDQAPRPWRNANDPPPAESQVERDQYPAPPAPADQRNYPQNDNYRVPSRLTIKAGTYVTVRVNQWLSSDRNQPGDAFNGTLEQPIVVDGIVVAQRGQTIAGRVSEAQKAGRVEGTSRLGLQLTELTLADGQQEPIQSQMINRNGSTSVGRDAAAIGGTTALGAAVGAAADWGRGAAIGAGAGAAAGIIGVLLTRGQPTVVYPESVLTFRLDAPVPVSTDRAPQAFRYVDRDDYGRADAPPPNVAMRQPGPPPPPPAYYSPYYAYDPYYWGPGFSVFVGPRYGFYGPRYYRGGYRGFRR